MKRMLLWSLLLGIGGPTKFSGDGLLDNPGGSASHCGWLRDDESFV